MANLELKTASGGSVTLVPEDGVSNVTATVKHESGVLASEQFALSNDLGVGQTWQEVTANRSAGVTYTNNTGKPILVTINNSTGTAGYLKVDGVVVEKQAATPTLTSVSAIVPNLSTYQLEYGSDFQIWTELR